MEKCEQYLQQIATNTLNTKNSIDSLNTKINTLNTKIDTLNSNLTGGSGGSSDENPLLEEVVFTNKILNNLNTMVEGSPVGKG